MILELKVELPYLKKGNLYNFDMDSGNVFRLCENGKFAEYPLRSGLAGYLWMLKYEDKKYFKEANSFKEE